MTEPTIFVKPQPRANPDAVELHSSWEMAVAPPNEPLLLPIGSNERKRIPLASGVLDYFPAALVAIAEVSYAGNEQHNPGKELHWSRGKSDDHADCVMRHLMEHGTLDSDGKRHTAKLAWRALALLQLELEADGAPPARGAY